MDLLPVGQRIHCLEDSTPQLHCFEEEDTAVTTVQWH